MEKWGPVDFIALMLGLAIFIVISGVMYKTIFIQSISAESNKLLTGIVMSVISIISLYIGAKLQKGKDK